MPDLAEVTDAIRFVELGAAALCGRALIMSPHVTDGDVIATPNAFFIGTGGSMTPNQKEAIRIVRRGMADVLRWLSEDPDAPIGKGEAIREKIVRTWAR